MRPAASPLKSTPPLPKVTAVTGALCCRSVAENAGLLEVPSHSCGVVPQAVANASLEAIMLLSVS